MADDVEVRLGANSDGVRKGMSEGASIAREKLGQIGDYLKKMAADGRTSESDLKNTFDRIKGGFDDTASSAKSATDKTSTAFSVMKLGIATAVLGIVSAMGAAVRGIEDLKKEAETIEGVQRVFGMTSDEASRLNVQLKLIGKTSEDYTSIGLKLANTIRTNEERMNSLGLKTRDAAGQFLPLNTVMQNAFTTMQTYRVGLDQNEFALEAFGRSAKDVYGYFDMQMPAVIERATQLQRELGIEMGPEKRAAIKAYAMESRALGIVWEEMRQSLGERLLPTMKALGQWVSGVAPGALTVLATAVKGVISVMEAFGSVFATVAIAGTSAFETIIASLSAVGRAFVAFVKGDWTAAAGILKQSGEQTKAMQAEAADSVRRVWTDSWTRVKTLWSTPPTVAGTGGGDRPAGGSRQWSAKPKKSSEAESRMAMFEGMLKAERDAYERMKLDQGSFERWSEEQTSAFWDRIKATYTLSAKELVSVESKWYDAQRTLRQKNFEAGIAQLEAEKASIKFDYDERVRIAEEAYRRIAAAYGATSREAIAAEARVTAEMERATEQRIRLAEVEVKRREALATHTIEMGRMQVQQDVAMRRINNEQAIAEEASLQQRLHAIRLGALQSQRALERDPVRIAAINAEIETLEATHQAKMTELANAAERERARYALEAANAVQQGFSSALAKTLDDPRKWREHWKAAIKDVTSSLNKIAADKITEMLMGSGTAGGGFLNDIMGKIFGGGGKGGTGKSAEAAASTTLVTAKSSETAAVTAATGATTSLSSVSAVLSSVMATLTTAATSAATALSMVGASGGGGLGSLFGGGGGGGGGIGGGAGGFGFDTALAGYAVGTPFVPQTQLAVVHKGEAIIPARYNNRSGGVNMGGVHVAVNTGGAPVDTRTLYQIEEATARGVRRAGLRAGAGG